MGVTFNVQTLNLSVPHGQFLESPAMTQQPQPIRGLVTADGESIGLQRNAEQESFSQDVVSRIAAEVAERLQNGAVSSGVRSDGSHWIPDPAPGKTKGFSTPDDGTENPVSGDVEPVPESAPAAPLTGPKITLRRCFDELRGAVDGIPRRVKWGRDSESQFRSLVKHWELWFQETGETEPDVRQIADGDFAKFAAWRGWELAERNASKNAGYFIKLLRSQTGRSASCKFGKSPADVVLNYVPDHGLPISEEETEDTSGDVWDEQIDLRRFDAAEFSALIDASQGFDWPECSGTELNPGLVWALVWGLDWYCGIRRSNLLLFDVRCFNLKLGMFRYRETKKKKPMTLPIPSWLRPLIERHIADAKRDGRQRLFPFPKSVCSSSSSVLYPRVESIYQRAELEPLIGPNGRSYWFHGLRSSCISEWKSRHPGYQRFVTGHKTENDVSDEHYARVQKELREFAESFPVPDALQRIVDFLNAGLV